MKEELVSNEIFPDILRYVQDIGLIKDESSKSKDEISELKSELSKMTESVAAMKKEVKKLKKASKLIKTESIEMKSNVQKEMGKLNVHFDALRLKIWEKQKNVKFENSTL